jgi:glucose uptake protein
MAFGAGVSFNLANMIMMGAVVVAGLSVPLALGLGGSLMVGAGFSLMLHNKTSPMLLFAGTACLLVAIVMLAVAYSFLISARTDQLVKEGKLKTTANVSGYNKAMLVSADAPSATKGLLLSVVAGALMWIMLPLVSSARAGDVGMGPYSLMLMFAAGMFVSTFIFELFIVNLPVEGEPVEITAYFSGGWRKHLAGIGAGVVLSSGILAWLVVEQGGPEGRPLISPVLTYALQQGAVLVGAIWGIFKLKDFRDAEARVRAMVWGFLFLFAAGLVSIGLASKVVAPGA